MADRVFMPTALDSNGTIAPGAKAYFYENGTTTPLTVYSDSGATTPHAQPLVADASGVFAAVYTNTTPLKINITDAADVDLPGFPSDNWFVSQSLGSGASALSFSPVPGNAATDTQAAIANNTARWEANPAILKALDVAGASTLRGSVLMESAEPILEFYETDGTADARRVRFSQSGDAFALTTLSDAGAVQSATHVFDRDGGAANANSVLVRSEGEARFSQRLRLGPFAVVSGGTFSEAHGLTDHANASLQFQLVCTTAEQGFSVGDIIYPTGSAASGATNVLNNLEIDATNVTGRYSAFSTAFAVLNKSALAPVFLTSASWESYVIVR